MRLVKTILILSLVPMMMSAQTFPSQRWHEGEAILKDKSIIQGQIRYDLEHDAIQVMVDGKVQTYSSQLVFKFTFHQEDINIHRTFYTLPYANQPGYKSIPRFFEVIIEGKMTLLAREYVAQITTSNGGARFNRYRNHPLARTTPRTVTRNYLTYKMFFLDHTGKLTEYEGRKKDLYFVLNENSGELKKYVKSNRLKIDKLEDVAKLVAHYNRMI